MSFPRSGEKQPERQKPNTVESWEQSHLVLVHRVHSWENSSGNTQIRWSWTHQCRGRTAGVKIMGLKMDPQQGENDRNRSTRGSVLKDMLLIRRDHLGVKYVLGLVPYNLKSKVSIYTANALDSCWASHFNPAHPVSLSTFTEQVYQHGNKRNQKESTATTEAGMRG